ncbi:YraN family protein [Paraglaciecola sp. 2405UD69-4]|uniref:YraN family protein n=1 Tax=Paraglaciecola sp. 2405UD69-4 TaxID=3391836 RepID=UPI0039C95AAA
MNWIKQAISPLIGKQAEDLARTFLEKQGLKFIQQNYRCRTGEIDLIMQDAEQLVFIEVKYRSKSHYGSAMEYFHATKRRKFESALMHFMMEKSLNPSIAPHRIDLIAIDNKNVNEDDINWFKNL